MYCVTLPASGSVSFFGIAASSAAKRASAFTSGGSVTTRSFCGGAADAGVMFLITESSTYHSSTNGHAAIA